MTAAPEYDYVTFFHNFAGIAEKCQKVMERFLSKRFVQPGEASPMQIAQIGEAFMEMFRQMTSDPDKLLQQQAAWWQDYMTMWENSARQFWGLDASTNATLSSAVKDRRFRDAAWENNIVFNFLRQSYLLTAQHLLGSVKQLDGLDEHTLRKLEFLTRQYVDAISPSNFLMTNPEVLRTTLETGGENLLHGLENLLNDLERSDSMLRVSMTDSSAFVLGKNLAATPGKVIYQNDLMQLIQYEPQTKKVYKTPLLLIPAWINKYYILDLQRENSMVRWLTEQGYTVFIISWVNPGKEHTEKTFDSYLQEGPLAALEAIERATGESSVSVLGYCLGGTLLACTVAWLKARGQDARIKTATYLTTMIDFKEAGELGIFIDEEQVKAVEKRMQETGYLRGEEMAYIFSMLRANDLIWSFIVNNYLLGKTPLPFDMLYWNADATRMPPRMHSFYLRNMYLENKLVQPGATVLGGVPLDLSRIDTPSYVFATREDHIAPWQATYAVTRLYQGPVRYVLGASGHVAGVVNPPAKNKYSYCVQDGKTSRYPQSPEAWLKNSSEHNGSWWEDWHNWLKAQSGPKVAAHLPGDGALKPIEDAPGSYVMQH